MYTIKLSGITIPLDAGIWQAKTLLGAKRIATRKAREYNMYKYPCDAIYIDDANGCTVSYKLHGHWINL